MNSNAGYRAGLRWPVVFWENHGLRQLRNDIDGRGIRGSGIGAIATPQVYRPAAIGHDEQRDITR